MQGSQLHTMPERTGACATQSRQVEAGNKEAQGAIKAPVGSSGGGGNSGGGSGRPAAAPATVSGGSSMEEQGGSVRDTEILREAAQ